jgi:prefoldin subunit 5
MENNKIEIITKEIESFSKRKTQTYDDLMRLDGIIAYLTNQLNQLTLKENQSTPKETTDSQ